MVQLNQKIIAVAVAVVFCVLASFWPQQREENMLELEQQEVQTEEAAAEAAAEAKITVYVSGAVGKPGLHEIAPGSRAVDAIEAAGGMTEEANKDRVNLAKICKDGMQVNVPRLSAKELRKLKQAQNVYIGDSANAVDNAVQSVNYVPAAQYDYSDGKVRLNSATLEELEELPGVGEITAQRIVEYRNLHGFNKIEDIMNVKGIGQAKFNKMRPYLDL